MIQKVDDRLITFFSRSEIVKQIAARLFRAVKVPWLMLMVDY